MSAKQKLAQIRNFNKYRLTGFTLDKSGLTEEEFKFFQEFKRTMLRHWDMQSRKLGLNVKNYQEK